MTRILYRGSDPHFQNRIAHVQPFGDFVSAKFEEMNAWLNFLPADFFGHYVILEGTPYHGKKTYRVRNTKTGGESALYDYDECVQIIANGLNGRLLGSFI